MAGWIVVVPVSMEADRASFPGADFIRCDEIERPQRRRASSDDTHVDFDSKMSCALMG